MKDAIDEKVSHLITTCALGNEECCVDNCNHPRFSRNRAVRYCHYHSDRKTRCRKCNRGLADGSEIQLCSNAVADDDTTLCSFCSDEREAEREAIKKGKQLEREATKLERLTIEKGIELKREARQLEKEKKQLERQARNLEKGNYVCGRCNKSFSSIYCKKKHVDKNVCIRATGVTHGYTHEQIQQEIACQRAKASNYLH